MIIFGWRSRMSPRSPLAGAGCKHCGTGSVNGLTIFRYFHIYWIPFFPYSRKFATECAHCKAYAVEPDIEKSVNGAVHFQEKAAFPVWMFAGLMLVAVAIGAGIFGDQQKASAAKTSGKPLPVSDPAHV